MGSRITWKKLPNGDIEQTTVTNIVKVKVIPAADFDVTAASITTAHQARLDRISRDTDHLNVMDGAKKAKDGEEVFIEYDDTGTSVVDKDTDPKVK